MLCVGGALHTSLSGLISECGAGFALVACMLMYLLFFVFVSAVQVYFHVDELSVHGYICKFLTVP